MNRKLVFVDLSYHFDGNEKDYNSVLKKYESGSGHHTFLGKKLQLHVIKHLHQNLQIKIGEVNYHFFEGSHSKLWLPFKLHRFIKTLQPDIILLHGYTNPIQMALLFLQTKSKLVIQDHGGKMPKGVSIFFQKRFSFMVKNYFFTAEAQVEQFVQKGIIKKKSFIFEVMEGSTHMRFGEKYDARKILNIEMDKTLFLWVGRLDENKDPITVLKGIEKYFALYPESLLYMIYGTNELEEKVTLLIHSSDQLKKRVKLIGKLSQLDLQNYYRSADFFILGSHAEGSGFALCEAMACACIPIVTNIPSFRRMTDNGTIGALWEAGNVESLLIALKKICRMELKNESQRAVHFFEEHLSFKAIAQQQFEAIQKIASSKK